MTFFGMQGQTNDAFVGDEPDGRGLPERKGFIGLENVSQRICRRLKT